MKASATRTRRGGLCGGWLTLIGLWLFSPAGACAQVFISEILADPPDDLTGDVNGDGRADRDEDEFVEFHNPESAAVDLSGWVLTGEKSGALFRFPAGALLPSGARAVVFGDDAPEEPFFFAAGGHLGQGLSNRQGALYLIDPAGPDTIEVEVRVRQETCTHRWLLQPGTSQPRRADTLITAGPLKPRNHP
ncbi:MAG: lamin tail domain-containing protein, partial [Candidatus Latescibacteria bacterium]|nr:lamin tail domain-containing protein [Candidatus Latescibacterota bacterium]